MTSLTLAIRMVFICALAFFAATAGDALVEGLSNAGLLWHGHYTDGSSLNLLPMALIATVAFVTILRFIVRATERRFGLTHTGLALATARALTVPLVARLFPIALALQFLTLFVMETIEQTVVYGHPVGGTLWLGGPIAMSILFHVLVAGLAACGLMRALLAAAHTTLAAMRVLLALFAPPSGTANPVRSRRTGHTLFSELLQLAARLRQRGPPAAIAYR